jgi:predicted AlkP superfamily pyrophosphatase or phosphodiesterase
MSNFFFDKDNCLVSISNAILHHFTGDSFHNPHPKLAEILAKNKYDKIVLMLFDGMGKSIQEKYFTKSDFILRKKAFEITSVFPPTTVAATTAVCSGKYPKETGWLGWRQYFKNHSVVVDMFTNNNSKTNEKVPGPFLSSLYCDYQKIWDILKDNGIKGGCLYPYPIDQMGPKSLDEFFQMADILMKKEGPHFYYMYNAEPDHSIHEYGTDDKRILHIVKEINRGVYKLSKNNKDNLIIVLADHSLINTTFFNIEEHEDFFSTLTTISSLDSRSSFFHLKEGKNEQFVELFNKYYGEHFLLFTKEEVIKQNWFGEGSAHPLFEDFIGDYMATSISKYGFTFGEENSMIGAHSGSLEEESLINVAIINK